MSKARERDPSLRVLTDAVTDVCPHCGVMVERVTLVNEVTIRCEVEEPISFADQTVHFVRLIHLCQDRSARRRALRDVVSQMPRK